MSKVQLTAKQKAKIKRAIKSLNDVNEEIQTDNSDKYINWYLEDNDNLNLMEDYSHDGNGSANHDAVIEVFNLDNSGGGGW